VYSGELENEESVEESSPKMANPGMVVGRMHWLAFNDVSHCAIVP
jgi:hypothetical protein